MTKCFLSIEVGNTESSSSVAPSCFGLADEKQIGEAEFNSERELLSSQLTRQIRSHKYLQWINWKICNELDAGNAEHNKEKKINLDEVKGKHARNKCKNTKKHERTSSREGRRKSHL